MINHLLNFASDPGKLAFASAASAVAGEVASVNPLQELAWIVAIIAGGLSAIKYMVYFWETYFKKFFSRLFSGLFIKKPQPTTRHKKPRR